MTIKQQGGIFGRNPTFNSVDVNNSLTVNTDVFSVSGSNVGVGTENAAVQFQIDSSSETEMAISKRANTSGILRFTLSDPTATTATWKIEHDAAEDLNIFGYTSDNFRVHTNSVERFNVLSSGDVTVSTGNLVIGTSGKGIDFSATAGTGTSELFDDYEEGSWTSTVGGTATYGVNSARYTKIGRQVFASFDLNITAIGTGSTSEISGLPFTCGDDIAEGVSISFYDGLATNVVELNAYVFGTTIRFRAAASAGTGLSQLAVLGDGCRVTGTAIYTTDS